MRPSPGELHMRDFVEAIRDTLDPEVVSEVDVIRGAALALFAKELEHKLRNLQDGETLQITFRVDIIGADGVVRGGAGDDRTMPEYAVWRGAVYARDGYVCQECGSTEGLQAHHVKAWRSHPESRFDVANGVTLCGPCHVKKHPHLRFARHGSTREAK